MSYSFFCIVTLGTSWHRISYERSILENVCTCDVNKLAQYWSPWCEDEFQRTVARCQSRSQREKVNCKINAYNFFALLKQVLWLYIRNFIGFINQYLGHDFIDYENHVRVCLYKLPEVMKFLIKFLWNCYCFMSHSLSVRNVAIMCLCKSLLFCCTTLMTAAFSCLLSALHAFFANAQ